MSDLRSIIKALRDQGFTVEQMRSGHYRVRDASGIFVTTLPATPSDWRSLKNAEAVLRRAGYRKPRKDGRQ